MEDNKEVVEKKEETTTTVVEKKEEPSQIKRTEKEKAEFSLKKNAERLKELGGDPNAILGVSLEEESDDTPLTVGKLKELQKATAQKSAIEMADSIDDEIEREEVKELLKTRITPSGNANADLVLARGAVNSKRNALIAEEAIRKTKPSRTASGGTQPGKSEDEFTPTAEEMVFMRPPYKMSKEKILALRKK